MSIPLKDFEQHIDAAILARGRSYYNSGQVSEAEELYPSQFEATVWGSAPYNVRIKLEGEQVTQYSCTCPYDYGPVCKHVVALMYYLRRDMETEPQSKPRKASKRKTVSQQIDELLTGVSHKDLIDFSRELAVKDKQYRRKLMTAFAHLNQKESKAFYAGQVRAVLQAASGEHGFIGWHEISTVGYQVNELLDTAEKHAGSKQYESALFICFAVMEEMVKALDFADDSNGDIGGCIYRASEMIHNIASESLRGPMRKQLFDYCFSAFVEGAFSGWDWNIDMLEILAMIYKTTEEAEHILGLIESTALSDYDLEQAQRIQLKIIKDIKGMKRHPNS